MVEEGQEEPECPIESEKEEQVDSELDNISEYKDYAHTESMHVYFTAAETYASS